MSEQINNREYRKNAIKEILKDLHKGASVDDVKDKFAHAFEGVSAKEISEAETALIAEGMPVAEVQKLCSVHAAVFKGSIEEIHQSIDPGYIAGHPVNILKKENRYLEKIIEEQILPHLPALPDAVALQALGQGLLALSKIDTHYIRKENLFFPYMEKYGITAPPKVMWGVDDDIRALIKECLQMIDAKPVDIAALKEKVEQATEEVQEMIFKEENILLPMLIETLTVDEWRKIADESGQLGFIIDNVGVWKRSEQKNKVEKAESILSGVINLPSGELKVEELVNLLDTLPFDITFVDKNDTVKYFSQGKERIFPRTKAIIGRNVSNCHPPASVHIVEGIVSDFKSGKKEEEAFWIKAKDAYIYIRYFAVRDKTGEYMGVLEVTQNIKPIQELTGEKRLIED